VRTSDRTRLARLESDAQWRASVAALPVPDHDYDAFVREFERCLVEEPNFWAEYQAAFAALWEQEHPRTEEQAR